MVIQEFSNSKYKFEFYINYDKKTWQQIKSEKQCFGLVNLGYYDMNKYQRAKTKQQVLDSTACDFILDGKSIKPLQWAEFGTCINENGDLFFGTPQGQKNYCVGLPPQYYNGQKYCTNTFVSRNGCTHIGFKTDGTPVILLASKDNGLTNIEANQYLLNAGCINILRYDGSWSSQGDLGNGKICKPSQTRIVQSYLLIYEREINRTIYRVQAGAFSIEANAIKLRDKIRELNDIYNAGYKNAYIRQIDGLYKVQIGAYSVYENAVKVQNSLVAQSIPAFVTTE